METGKTRRENCHHCFQALSADGPLTTEIDDARMSIDIENKRRQLPNNTLCNGTDRDEIPAALSRFWTR